MIASKLKSLSSIDLTEPDHPDDEGSFSIPFDAVIGPVAEEGGDIFSFTAVNAAFLASQGRTTWGRGILFVPNFSWPTIQAAVERLVAQVQRPTWQEAAVEFNKVLCWEFDSYREAKP